MKSFGHCSQKGGRRGWGLKLKLICFMSPQEAQGSMGSPGAERGALLLFVLVK